MTAHWERKNWPADDMVADLLKCAGIPDNSQSQSQLRETLRNASNFCRFARMEQCRVPQKAYTKAAAAAKALLSAMRELNRYTRRRAERSVGPGELDVAPDDWLKEEDRSGAEYYVEKVLAAVNKRSPDFAGSSPKRGQPPKRAKAIVVGQALGFLRDCVPGSALPDRPTKIRLSN